MSLGIDLEIFDILKPDLHLYKNHMEVNLATIVSDKARPQPSH